MDMTSEPRIAHDALLGDIDVDRMEQVMNSEVAAIREALPALSVRQALIDHFTRNSPQAVLKGMRERLNSERLNSFIDAIREVMYEPGQTVVPDGFRIDVSDRGVIRLVNGAMA